MKTMKRVEIVIDAYHAPETCKALRKAGAVSYTIIKDVHGSGDRGERSGDDLTILFRNCLILVACPPEQVDAVTKAVQPLLKRHGGMCLVSDAEWLEH